MNHKALSTLSGTRLLFRLLPFLILLFGLNVCAEDPAKSRIEEGIQHKVADFPNVALIGDAANTFGCSGTLVGPRHVLTAGHCALSPEIGGGLGDTDGRVTIGGKVYNTTRLIINPSYHPALVGKPGIVDASIFELDSPVPDIVPASLMRDAPTIGMTVTIVGFGKLGSGQSGINNKLPATGTVFSGTNSIDAITPTTISWTFNPGTSGIAPGDSGGPAFVDTRVAGIHSLFRSSSRRLGGFGTVNQDTRVDTIAPWIDSIVSGATSNTPPTITTNANVSSPSIAVGKPATFSVTATDPDQDQTLLYIWNFGDGTADTGMTVDHVFDFPGDYVATVTVSDGIATASSSVNVHANGDSSTSLALTKLQLFANFGQTFSDSFTIEGTLAPFPDNLTVSPLVINVGGAKSAFLLDSRGRGVSIDGTITVNSKSKTFKALVKKEDFAQFWGKYGIVDKDVNKVPLTMPVSITFDEKIYFVNQNLTYTARAGRTGRTK